MCEWCFSGNPTGYHMAVFDLLMTTLKLLFRCSILPPFIRDKCYASTLKDVGQQASPVFSGSHARVREVEAWHTTKSWYLVRPCPASLLMLGHTFPAQDYFVLPSQAKGDVMAICASHDWVYSPIIGIITFCTSIHTFVSAAARWPSRRGVRVRKSTRP